MNSSLSFGQAALISRRTNDEMYFTLIRTLSPFVYSDDSDNNDEDDDDDQPDKFEGSCDDKKEESHQSKLDEVLAKFRTRVRSLQQEQPRQVTPKFGNTNQKPLERTLVE